MTARLLAWGRRYWWVIVTFALVLGVLAYVAQGAINDSEERRASRARIEASTTEAAELGRRIERVATAIESATSPQARDRSAAAMAGAIAELRRSIDCAALYTAGERPPACVDVAGRMDRLRAGEDPFATTTTTTTTGADR